ncbi:hypothetical protein ACFO9Q_03805 [Paenibacillus sp. GCM10023252]|uniref:hypothetical protein n=1 Tax=Paenibacillus sp. GCM10023252 TaxID=3252649 RepID=UPI00360FE1D7
MSDRTNEIPLEIKAKLMQHYGLIGKQQTKSGTGEQSMNGYLPPQAAAQSMKPLIIVPGVGIGPLKLGMSRGEAQEVFSHNSTLEFYASHMEYDSDDKLIGMEISNPYGPSSLVLLYNGVDVFKTKAEALVSVIEEAAPYIRDGSSESGYGYIFRELQMSVWRPVVDEEHLTFATVAIASPGYY